MKNAILIACVAAIVVVMGSAAGGIGAVVLFEESFEDRSVGSAPDWTPQHNSNQRITDTTASDGDQSVRHAVSAYSAGSRYKSFDAPMIP